MNGEDTQTVKSAINTTELLCRPTMYVDASEPNAPTTTENRATIRRVLYFAPAFTVSSPHVLMIRCDGWRHLHQQGPRHTGAPDPVVRLAHLSASWRHMRPQTRQDSLWTQIVAPHLGHDHFTFSLSTKARSPSPAIALRFSIMLIPYFVRYRLSRCLRRSQGKTAQSEHISPRIEPQFLILHSIRVLGFLRSSTLQPGHLLRLR